MLTIPVDGRASADRVLDSLGAYCGQQSVSSVFIWALEIIQEMASEMNKSKRQIVLSVTIADWNY